MRIYYFDTEVGALATAAISHLLEKDSQRVDELHASKTIFKVLDSQLSSNLL